MLNIHNSNPDPYFNLAMEKYLLKNSFEDIFMMRQNESSVIIEKHQDVYVEVNTDLVSIEQLKTEQK